jgi:20S proteasome subunit alpha 3
VLAAERRVVSKLLAPSKTSEKLYKIDDHVVCLVAGLTADADILIQQARLGSQRYLLQYQEEMPVENLVKNVCNYKQSYTQFGGKILFLFTKSYSHILTYSLTLIQFRFKTIWCSIFICRL